MKLITLVENSAARPGLGAEHGLSLYIETDGRRILFDMGQRDLFAKNAEALGVDLSQVDLAVVSHGHYDHGGGLATFLERNAKAPVYIHKQAFGEHCNAAGKYIGLDPALRTERRLIFTEGEAVPAPGMTLTDCNTLGWRFPAWGLSRREAGQTQPDPFFHEQYLLITEGKRRILISGCSHKGIVNIAEHFRPDVLVGGFHLNKQEDPAQLAAIAEALEKTGALYYTGHCTGRPQFDRMKQILGDRLGVIAAGTVTEL